MDTRQERLAQAAKEQREREFQQMKKDIRDMLKFQKMVKNILRDHESRIRQASKKK